MPTITRLQEPVAVSESESVEFSCYAVGTPAPSIHWEFNGRTVATGNTLTIGTYTPLCDTLILRFGKCVR